MSWVGDIVHRDWRGRFFGIRQRAASTASVIFLMSAGYLLDKYREVGREDIGHVVLGAIAVVMGTISTVLLSTIPRTIHHSKHIEEHDVSKVKPWKDPAYRKVMIDHLSKSL